MYLTGVADFSQYFISLQKPLINLSDIIIIEEKAHLFFLSNVVKLSDLPTTAVHRVLT
jgi:hypothetical protein